MKIRGSLLILLCSVLLMVMMSNSSSHVVGQTAYLTYLPAIVRPPTPSTLGVEIAAVANPQLLVERAQEANIFWVRRNGLLWSAVQPNGPTEWNWQAVSALESDLQLLSQKGFRIILVIRSTPGWAQEYPGNFCGPVAENRLGNFSAFMYEVVRRYSAPPFNIQHFEIWNEPDVHYEFDPMSPYGCWGNNQDPYFGGAVYAGMLKAVYPQVKNANPNAQLVLGGLLLDHDPGECGTALNKPACFLEGILRAGGGSYFDVLNFHGYAQYWAAQNPIYLERSYASWPNGGVVLGKLNFLRGVMAKYGASKPIVQTEAGLTLVNDEVAASFERAKADYLVWLYVRNQAEGIAATVWYRLDGPGWRSGSLLDANQDPLPAFTALKFLASQTLSATYTGRVGSMPTGVEGFEYQRGSTKLWIVFSVTNAAPNLNLPVGVTQVYDVLGGSVTPVGGSVTLDHPLYLVFGP